MTLHEQWLTMLTMIAGGIWLGFALETYRRLFYRLLAHALWAYVLETLFWLSQTILLFTLLYRVNHAALSIYVFLACLLGYSIYQVLFRNVYQTVLESVIRFCQKLFTWLLQVLYVLLLQPLWAIVHFCLRLLYRLWLLLRWLLLFIFRCLHSLLQFLLPKKVYRIISKWYAVCSTIGNKLILFVSNLWRNGGNDH